MLALGPMQAMSKLAILLCSYTHQVGDKDKCNIQQLHIHQIGDKEDKCNKAVDAGKAPTKNAKGGIACKGAQVGEGRSGLVAVCQPDQTNVVCCELGDTARTHTHTHTQASISKCLNHFVLDRQQSNAELI